MKLKITTREVVTKSYWALNLREYLEHKGKSQADMARKFKFTPSYISDIALMKRPLQIEMKNWLEGL